MVESFHQLLRLCTRAFWLFDHESSAANYEHYGCDIYVMDVFTAANTDRLTGDDVPPINRTCQLSIFLRSDHYVIVGPLR